MVMVAARSMKMASVMYSPSGRVPQQASRLDLPEIVTCGNGKNREKMVPRVSQNMGFIGGRNDIRPCTGAPHGLAMWVGP